VQSLVPLHAACVGAGGNGALLIGASGSGKSTLALHALADRMELLSEDSAFVALESLRVTGVPNYLHVSSSALRLLRSVELRRAVARSPTIERRSGTRKLEVDLRAFSARIARSPLRLAAIVFLSKRTTSRSAALHRLEDRTWLRRLRREQPYACAQPNWRAFERRIADLPTYELRRSEHPDVAIHLLRSVL
jgi:energy-coupling factor transporter ATP-binding protein EcfA2